MNKACYKLAHFETKKCFDEIVPNPLLNAESGNKYYNYISFIKDIKQIYTHGEFYECNPYDDSDINSIIDEINSVLNSKAELKHNHDVSDLVANDGDGKILVSDNNGFILKDVQEIIGVTNTSKQLKFYCIEPVVVTVNGVDYEYGSNSYVNIYFKDDDVFELTTTSEKSILSLDAWPGYLGTFYN